MENRGWTLKWGALALKEKDNSLVNIIKEYKEQNIKRGIESNQINELFQEKIERLVDIFRAEDNISNIKYNSTKGYSIRLNDGIIELLEPIYFSIKTPLKPTEETVDFSFSKSSDPINDVCHFLYNGYFYFIYWETSSSNSPLVYIEIRNLIQNLINKSKNYEVFSVPPTPFREEIFIKTSYDGKSNNVTISAIEKNEICVVLPTNIEETDFFQKLYSSAFGSLLSYFNRLEEVNKISELENSIRDNFSKLVLDCNELQNTSSIKIMKRRALKKQMKKNISKQFDDYSQYNSLYNSLISNKEDSLAEIKINKFFYIHLAKFAKELEIPNYNFELAHSLIEYSKDIIVAEEQNNNNFFGVIIGALIVIITQFLTSP